LILAFSNCSSKVQAGFKDLDVNDLLLDFSSWRNTETRSMVHARRVQHAHPKAAPQPAKELQHGCPQEDTYILVCYLGYKYLMYFKWLF
jgi:hypothetical protein